MNNFSFSIKQTVDYVNGSPFQVNVIIIKIVNGKFPISSQIPFVSVYDSNNSVSSFSTRITPNKKNIMGYFTSDAFAIFTGNVTIAFGQGGLPIAEFENIDINNIESLDPILAALNAPMGDNNWLGTLS